MPTVKRGDKGYYIVSRRRGRYITHQLSSEGETFLRDRYGRLDNLEIDVPTLLHLKDRGDAETGRQRRRRQEDARFRADGSVSRPSRPQSAGATNMVVCGQCRSVVAASPFCARCGAPLSRRPETPSPKAAQDSFYKVLGTVVLILFVLYLIFHRR